MSANLYELLYISVLYFFTKLLLMIFLTVFKENNFQILISFHGNVIVDHLACSQKIIRTATGATAFVDNL